MSNLELKIEGMSCGGCSGRLVSLLEKAPGVIKVAVSHQDGTGEIDIDDNIVSQQDIVTIIENAGFDVVGA